MSTATAEKKESLLQQRSKEAQELGLIKYIRKEDYYLDEKEWQKVIEETMEAAKTDAEPKKKTSYEIMSDAGAIKLEIEKVLVEDPDDAEERLDELFGQLGNLKQDAEDKLESYVWVKDKLMEHVKSAEAVKKYYDSQKKKFHKTQKARDNDVNRLKDRVVDFLEKMFDGKTKVNGKSISVVEKITGSISDEALAHETLREDGLSWVEYPVSGEKVKDLKTRVANILELMQDEKGDPKPVDLVDLQTKLMDFQSEFAHVEPQYQFDSGTQINSFVNERVKKRREVRLKLQAQFDGLDPEDMDPEQREEFEVLLKAELEAYPLDGIEVYVTKYPRGL